MKKTAIVIALGITACSAFAQTETSSSSQQSPSASLPMSGQDEASQMQARLQPKTVNDVSYICGGVGKEEAAYLKQEARKHDLMLTFADKRGEFLADVNVEVVDARGNPVLKTNCDGPMMVLDLPRHGRYTVHAEAAGYEINRTVQVLQRKQNVASAVLNWPAQAVHAASPAETASGGGKPAGAAGEGSR